MLPPVVGYVRGLWLASNTHAAALRRPLGAETAHGNGGLGRHWQQKAGAGGMLVGGDDGLEQGFQGGGGGDKGEPE